MQSLKDVSFQILDGSSSVIKQKHHIWKKQDVVGSWFVLFDAVRMGLGGMVSETRDILKQKINSFRVENCPGSKKNPGKG
jgi:hypothetical protein